MSTEDMRNRTDRLNEALLTLLRDLAEVLAKDWDGQLRQMKGNISEAMRRALDIAI